MSGHSKWATIKRKKGSADVARGKLFSKLIKEITIAAREGGGDIENNASLRMAVEKARQSNMPNDNIMKGIKRGTGELGSVVLEQMVYEGYGPGGVAFYLEITTDNKNRTAAEIRSLFSKNGGNLGTSGSVAYMFEKKGQIQIARDAVNEDAVMEIALEAGADDIETDDNGYEVTTAPDQLHKVMNAFRKKNIELESAGVVMIPKSTIRVTGKAAEQVLRLMDYFEEHEDVANVFANFDIDEAEMMAMS